IQFNGHTLPNVVDFQVNGDIIALRVADILFESPIAQELNGDTDSNDIVMFAYSFKSRRVFSTHMPSKQCTVARCEPGVPYKIRDDSIFFTTFEPDQGCTPPATDCIASSFSSEGGGVDLNRDGKLGTVLQIFSDTDGDGVFDTEDNCKSIPNRDQLDTDGDGI